MSNQKTIVSILAIIALVISTLYLQSAIFVKLGLDQSRLITPQSFTDNAIAMKETGLILSGIAALLLFLYIKEQPPLLKLIYVAGGAVTTGVGVFAITKGNMFTVEGIVGALFVIFGVNMMMRLIKKKLF